jgi:hypothetical protein
VAPKDFVTSSGKDATLGSKFNLKEFPLAKNAKGEID